MARLGVALRLAPNQVAYLNNLLLPRGNESRHARQGLLAAVQAMVDHAEPSPACILDLRFDILYWNRSIAAMPGDFASLPPAERNVLWTMLRWPHMRQNWANRDGNVRNIITGFRMQRSMLPPDDAAANELIARFSAGDEHSPPGGLPPVPSRRPCRDSGSGMAVGGVGMHPQRRRMTMAGGPDDREGGGDETRVRIVNRRFRQEAPNSAPRPTNNDQPTTTRSGTSTVANTVSVPLSTAMTTS